MSFNAAVIRKVIETQDDLGNVTRMIVCVDIKDTEMTNTKYAEFDLTGSDLNKIMKSQDKGAELAAVLKPKIKAVYDAWMNDSGKKKPHKMGKSEILAEFGTDTITALV